MQSLETKLVTSIECGQYYALALGQTLRLQDSNRVQPLTHSILDFDVRELSADKDDARNAYKEGNHSPLRMKTSTSRKNRSVCSTTKLSVVPGKRDMNNVLGNRHVGGCCGGKL